MYKFIKNNYSMYGTITLLRYTILDFFYCTFKDDYHRIKIHFTNMFLIIIIINLLLKKDIFKTINKMKFLSLNKFIVRISNEISNVYVCINFFAKKLNRSLYID